MIDVTLAPRNASFKSSARCEPASVRIGSFAGAAARSAWRTRMTVEGWAPTVDATTRAAPTIRRISRMLRENLLEGRREARHLLYGSDRDAHVLVHRRERPADEHAVLPELRLHLLDRPLDVHHEEVAVRRDRAVAERLEVGHGLLAQPERFLLDLGHRFHVVQRRNASPQHGGVDGPGRPG